MHSAKLFLFHTVWIWGETSVWGEWWALYQLMPHGLSAPLEKANTCWVISGSLLTLFIVVQNREQGNCTCTSVCTLELFLWSTPQICHARNRDIWQQIKTIPQSKTRALIASLPQLKKLKPKLIHALNPSLPVSLKLQMAGCSSACGQPWHLASAAWDTLHFGSHF